MPSINNKSLSAEERKKRDDKWAEMELQRREGVGPHHENVRVVEKPGPVRVMDEHIQGGIAVRVIPGPDPNVAPHNYPNHQGGTPVVEGRVVPNQAQSGPVPQQHLEPQPQPPGPSAAPYSPTRVSRPVRSTMAPNQGVPPMMPNVPNTTRHVGPQVQGEHPNVVTHAPQAQISQPVPNEAQTELSATGGFEVRQVETPAHLNAPEVDLGVVLSAHMRPGLTQPQINSLVEQTVRPKTFLVWVSPGVQVDEYAISALPQVRTNLDWGPWARWDFSVAQLGTEYVAVLDDDAILQPGWLETALDHLKENPADVVTAQGYSLNNHEDFSEADFIVGGKADFGAKVWVFKPEIFQDPGPWRRHPTGWDIHLSWSSQQAGGSTVVISDALVEGIETSPGLRSLSDTTEVRNMMIEEALEGGWDPENMDSATP